MDNKFKLRLYKKTGKEKGNMDKEFFYNSAEELRTAYKPLCSSSNHALDPTIWVRSGNEEWTRYSEADFDKFFSEKKRRIDITTEDVKIDIMTEVFKRTGYLSADLDEETIKVKWDLLFNPDRYFGIDTPDDKTWISFYIYWHSDGTITAKYNINRPYGGEEDQDWPLTEKEQDFFLSRLEIYTLENEDDDVFNNEEWKNVLSRIKEKYQ